MGIVIFCSTSPGDAPGKIVEIRTWYKLTFGNASPKVKTQPKIREMVPKEKVQPKQPVTPKPPVTPRKPDIRKSIPDKLAPAKPNPQPEKRK